MLDWIKVEELKCKINELDHNVAQLRQKYKTDHILNKFLVQDSEINIEVWFNFNSQMHVLNLFQHIE